MEHTVKKILEMAGIAPIREMKGTIMTAPVSHSPGVHHTNAQVPANKRENRHTQPPAVHQQDSVQLSDAAKAALKSGSSGDVDHDGDSR